MTEDKVEPREINWRHLLPWTVLFRSFGVAMGLSKLLLAAAGILVMAVGWWLLAVAFFNPVQKPEWPPPHVVADTNKEEAWNRFREDRNAWNLLLETAGPPGASEVFDPADLADSLKEFDTYRGVVQDANGDTIVNAKVGVRTMLGKPVGNGLMNRADVYAGYGRALTGEVWYKDLMRFELRVRY